MVHLLFGAYMARLCDNLQPRFASLVRPCLLILLAQQPTSCLKVFVHTDNVYPREFCTSKGLPYCDLVIASETTIRQSAESGYALSKDFAQFRLLYSSPRQFLSSPGSRRLAVASRIAWHVTNARESVGILRVNKRNRSDAWVSTAVLEQDIFISGSKDRNRALEGDLVAVELLDASEVWHIKKEKEKLRRDILKLLGRA